MKIFVITLADSKERQAHMQKLLDEYNIEFEFIYGVDGRKFTDTDINNYYDSKKAKKVEKELTNTDIGCSMSHKLVYEKMVKENIERAIILEDGISLHPDIISIIIFLNNFKIDKYAIKLDRNNARQNHNDNLDFAYYTPWHRKRITENYFLCQPFGDPTLTGGYYIDIKAANILYSLMPKIFLTPDAWWYFRKNIKFRMINKALIWRDRTQIPSIMQARNEKKQKETFLLKCFNTMIKIMKYLIKLPILLFK